MIGSEAESGDGRRGRLTVGAIKPSTVSTAPLRTFRSLHARPINLVVFQGSHVRPKADHQASSQGGLPA